VPGLGGMVVPYRRWPKAAAAFHGMLRRAERMSAETAQAWGIIDTVMDDHAELITAAVARVHSLPRLSPASEHISGPVQMAPLAAVDPVAADGQRLSVEVIRILESAILEAAAAPSLSAALDIGYRAFGTSACTAAAREGIAAFQQRRPADFVKTG